jgi:hypothetical protein
MLVRGLVSYGGILLGKKMVCGFTGLVFGFTGLDFVREF